MKKTKQLGLIVITFVVLLFLQNCTSESEVELEEVQNVQETSVENTVNSSASKMIAFEGDLYHVRFQWPENKTEAEKEYTRNYYLNENSEYIIFSENNFGFEGNDFSLPEEWAVKRMTGTHIFALCEGCVPPDGDIIFGINPDIEPVTIIESTPM